MTKAKRAPETAARKPMAGRPRKDLPRYAGLKLTPKRKAFLEMRVMDGLTLEQAVEALGMSKAWGREIYRSAVCLAFAHELRDALLAEAEAGNVRALVAIRDESDSGAARVAAAKEIRELARAKDAVRPDERPGYVIALSDDALARLKLVTSPGAVIDHAPAAVPTELAAPGGYVLRLPASAADRDTAADEGDSDD